MIVNMHEAKTQLSRLVQQAAAGEEIIIAKAGEPLVRLVRYEPHAPTRTPGIWKGRVRIGPDFDDELDADVLAGFTGDRE